MKERKTMQNETDIDALARMLVEIDRAVTALPWWTAFHNYDLDEETAAKLTAMGDVAKNVLFDMADLFEAHAKKRNTGKKGNAE